MRAHHLAPHRAVVCPLLLRLRLVDVAQLLTGIEARRRRVGDALELDQARVVVLVHARALETEHQAADVQSASSNKHENTIGQYIFLDSIASPAAFARRRGRHRRQDLETPTTRVSHHHPMHAPTRRRAPAARATARRPRARHTSHHPSPRARSRLHRAVARAPAPQTFPHARENPKNARDPRARIGALYRVSTASARARDGGIGSTRARSTYLVGSPFAIVVVASRKDGTRDASARARAAATEGAPF